jgi:hypothetical protein
VPSARGATTRDKGARDRAPFGIESHEQRYRDAADDPDARRAAVADAAALGDGARPLLETALRDAHPAVRAEAAIAVMAAMGVEQAGSAAESSGSEPRAAVGAVLLERLAVEPDATVRGFVVRALGRLHVHGAVRSLGALATNDGELGREACFALARIRTPEALAALAVDEGASAERRELVEFLTSDAFLEQERRLERLR